MENISVLPKPYQKPYPPIHQVVDGIRSIEWAAQQGLNIIMWIPTVKALKLNLKHLKMQNQKLKKEMYQWVKVFL
jgi:alkanesulfonate monooxygenase SsuD/methylene tetrahydromethanopterin reductase-like flavin-dependent oxidoreductase (luciferase family)